MRNAFADEVTKLGMVDPRLVLLSGDIGNKLFDRFKAAQPERFFNCGVAEQNMTGVATGLAMNGLRPFTYTIAPFCTTRCLEQIRTDVAYHEAPVTIVAVGAGLAYAGLGPTHHACEDIAFLRAIPNMVVLAPGDAWELRAAVRAVLAQDRPAYIRLGKKGEPLVHGGPLPDFQIGKAITVVEGLDVCLLSTGNMLPEAVAAASLLRQKGVATRVVSFHTVKPLDTACLREAFTRFSLVATVEEHSLIGGFGSAVAEWVSDHLAGGARLIRFGAPDQFFKKSGEHEYARRELGLTAEHIAERLVRAISQPAA
ncbi:MAG: transketolase C-terminal domain-containing protein [Phenylobacterium sp.]|uniref:transketolase family protein n=1 Tax=Phenylobacterium sp. TaxID=1871053 RepID=UPI002737677C|nr:transketolase C-terminal domain-containing protein [Phenylobacterium sp.]MDP3746757.1 transketolase C-terminal domain-containing protein [Phenylobacterium sp.]